MKPIVFYKPPDDGNNCYIHNMFFNSIMDYLRDNKIGYSIESINLANIHNSTVLIFCLYLNKETIPILKNNGNFICSFDANDSTTLYHEYAGIEEAKSIDLIMKFAGVQKTETSIETRIDNNVNYSIFDVPFFINKYGEVYKHFLDTHRIKPMPHAPWTDYISPPYVEYKDKIKLGLVRGGHHYLRYHLYLNLLRAGLVDRSSVFQTRAYFDSYCDSCKGSYNKYSFFVMDSIKDINCTRVGINENPIPEGFLQRGGPWNNACVPNFFWLANEYRKTHGDFDIEILTASLNGVPDINYTDILKNYLFYCDFKWIYSISIPPRFWEAANARTISLYPSRTADQKYYPDLRENEHYMTFKEDFSNLTDVFTVTEEKYRHISLNAYDMYMKYIRGGKYRVSAILLEYILNSIENTKEV